jgi:hypothetical protein
MNWDLTKPFLTCPHCGYRFTRNCTGRVPFHHAAGPRRHTPCVDDSRTGTECPQSGRYYPNQETHVMNVPDDYLLQPGDVIRLAEGHCSVYENLPQSRKLCEHEYTLGKSDRLGGEYIVTATAFEGGGTAHGPGDVFPDGHHVQCQRVDNPKICVNFYQTGSFTAMISRIAPVRRVRKFEVHVPRKRK